MQTKPAKQTEIASQTQGSAGLNTWSEKLWWLWGPLVAFIVGLPLLRVYFSGEDFQFVQFAASGKAFYEPAQNLFYRPLPNLLWQLDYALWGLHAGGYHLTNLLLHALNAVLVGLLGRRLGLGRAGAGLAAGVFALHPLHTEPVAWLAARPDLAATALAMLSLLAFLKWCDRQQPQFYLLTLACYAAALFCKESVVGLPLAMAAMGGWNLRGSGRMSATVTSKQTSRPRSFKFFTFQTLLPGGSLWAGFILVLALNAGVRWLALAGIGGYTESVGSWPVNALWNVTVGLWLPLLLPINLSSAGPVGAGLLAAGLGFGWLSLFWLARPDFRHILKGFPNFKPLSSRPAPSRASAKASSPATSNPFRAALALMYAGLLPVLGAAPVTANLAQSRLLYLPSVGFCLLVALLIRPLKSVPQPGRRTPRLLSFPFTIFALFVVLLVVAGGPWLTAGRLVEQTFELAKSANLGLQAGDTVYFEGLPDNYRGAYIWRNGLGEATRLLIGPGVSGVKRGEDVNADYRLSERGRLWFVRYQGGTGAGAEAELQRVFTYGLVDGSEARPTNGTNWNFADCPSSSGWQWLSREGNLECQRGRGWLFNSGGQKTDLTLQSPSLPSPSNPQALSAASSSPFSVLHPSAYLEAVVYTDFDFQQPEIYGELSATGPAGQVYFRQSMRLAADGRQHRYLFEVPTTPELGPLNLSLKLNRFRSNILWQSLSWKSKGAGST